MTESESRILTRPRPQSRLSAACPELSPFWALLGDTVGAQGWAWALLSIGPIKWQLGGGNGGQQGGDWPCLLQPQGLLCGAGLMGWWEGVGGDSQELAGIMSLPLPPFTTKYDSPWGREPESLAHSPTQQLSPRMRMHQSQLSLTHYLQDVWPEASHISSVSLSVWICKTGIGTTS